MGKGCTGWELSGLGQGSIRGEAEGNAFLMPVSGQAILDKCPSSSGHMRAQDQADPWLCRRGGEV